MKKSDRAKKHTAKVIEAAARAHEALDYFSGNVTNPFDELIPSLVEADSWDSHRRIFLIHHHEQQEVRDGCVDRRSWGLFGVGLAESGAPLW
ncbi:hypothetical protein K3M67_21660 (plasmid) [Sphingobium sp. V4]|uniref:hypothetical protein n=1 Tax=Sphingobium sp. V4 TaxID=3038927 RepID=UPI002557D153|nr:hypothetical protein [Sphingobium sp. V4]WIW91192.1 hypothetical protein K3M67_21660 [Sphingobium sp. V4]